MYVIMVERLFNCGFVGGGTQENENDDEDDNIHIMYPTLT